DARFHQFRSLAESIDLGFHHRGGRVIELEDCRQVARMALWLAVSRIEDPISAPAYLSRSIRGALLHHARDLGRTIRVPRREQEKPGARHPWVLTSLDQPCPSGEGTLLDRVADQALAPEVPAPEAESLSPEAAALEQLLDQLPARQAAVLRLRHLQGLSCREVARQLGVSTMSVSRDERQALARLRQELRA
ncbi:MAG: sigma-70 family RNA polymerase sigma factor, partial [Prochlorococcaceae cyanobacterium]